MRRLIPDETPVFMRLLRNKLLLKWREPRVGWKFVKKQLSWSDWLRWMLRLVVKSIGVMLLLFAAIGLIRGDVKSIADLISFEPVAVGAGIGIFLFLLRWLVSIGPVEIQVREKNIVRITAGETSLIPYKEVQRCTIRNVELEGQKLEILEIRYWDGNECILEIDPSVPGDTVIDTLRQRGLEVRRN